MSSGANNRWIFVHLIHHLAIVCTVVLLTTRDRLGVQKGVLTVTVHWFQQTTGRNYVLTFPVSCRRSSLSCWSVSDALCTSWNDVSPLTEDIAPANTTWHYNGALRKTPQMQSSHKFAYCACKGWLASFLSDKWDENYSHTSTGWLRCRLSFALLRASIIRGARSSMNGPILMCWSNKIYHCAWSLYFFSLAYSYSLTLFFLNCPGYFILACLLIKNARTHARTRTHTHTHTHTHKAPPLLCSAGQHTCTTRCQLRTSFKRMIAVKVDVFIHIPHLLLRKISIFCRPVVYCCVQLKMISLLIWIV